ncbi:hypothetical protein KM043_017443 [Ampulex compressa]|nr:hypothetical protein KM043_017443 [Ampulex compressa]
MREEGSRDLVCGSLRFSTSYPLESKQSFRIDKIGRAVCPPRPADCCFCDVYECGKIHGACGLPRILTLSNELPRGPKSYRERIAMKIVSSFFVLDGNSSAR